MKPTKQNRINDLAWEVVDIILNKPVVKEEAEDLEEQLAGVIKKLKQ